MTALAAAPEHVHLVGIGGTGMTALAGLLRGAGCRVTGSDGQLYPPTSTILERLDLQLYTGFDATHLEPRPDLVVVGNAISRGNPEVEEVLDQGMPFTSMPALIHERFLRGRHSIVVAGTHGKTTTASLMAWVLASAGRDPGFLIGGAPLNFGLPFHRGEGKAFVIEGDEYDTAFFDKGPKFMHYRPDTVLLGTVEFDHADIYRDLDAVKTAFRRLVNLVPRRGLIVRHEESSPTVEVSSAAFSRVEGYGFDRGQWRAVDVRETPEGSCFRVLYEDRPFVDARLPMVGRHNLRNGLAVIAAAHDQGLTAKEIAAGLDSFRGVKRRMELRGDAAGVRVYDDFAHHPTAIAESLRGMRLRHPDNKIWAVVQPRSYSMRHSTFQRDLAQVFDDADEIVIARVHRAENVPAAERLDAERLAEELTAGGQHARYLPEVAAIVDYLVGAARDGDLVVVMSNGGFDGLHERLLEALHDRPNGA
jgi:UDP-N-acetylmuramate: L-alanyl-gamma-D-glutamyl-meso-diaminopimelate ligase